LTFFFYFIDTLATVLMIAILIRAILSWFPISRENPFAQVVFQVTEPVLAPLRRVVPSLGMIDITPLVALLLLQMIQVMIQSLRGPF
jgi:YggT family protein